MPLPWTGAVVLSNAKNPEEFLPVRMFGMSGEKPLAALPGAGRIGILRFAQDDLLNNAEDLVNSA